MTVIIDDEMLRTEFISAFLRVWETSIGAPLVESDSIKAFEMKTGWVAGVVWIGGKWTGSVTLAFPEKLAREMTAKMLEIDLAEVSDLQYGDAVRELANMSAGNLKSALPGPCALATPGYFEIRSPEDLNEPFKTIISLNYSYHDIPLVAQLRALE